MTLGMAWVRNFGSVRELIVVSDSRLSGGQFWDSNPKIMLLPRSVVFFHSPEAHSMLIH
jgi:hypothetical protein